MKKRIFCLLLCLCMVLALCPVTAFADVPPDTIVGDLDFDGNVTTIDAVRLQKYLEGLESFTNEQLVVADFNGDGVVNYSDLTELRKATGYVFIAITIDNFEPGITLADLGYTITSTPDVEFSTNDMRVSVQKIINLGNGSITYEDVGVADMFEADTNYMFTIHLDHNNLTQPPVITVNDKEVSFTVDSNEYSFTYQDTPEPSQYTITYAPGEYGTGSIPAGTKTHGKDFTLSSDTFTRQDYVQCCWRTSDNLTDYPLGGIYSIDADVTLYPVWDKIETVTADFTTTVKQGGSAAPRKTVFELEVIDSQGNELVYGGVKVTAAVTTNGKGSYEGAMTFTGSLEDLDDMLGEGAFVRQVNAGKANWTYDDTVWWLRLFDGAAYASTDDAASGYTVLIYPTLYEETGDGGKIYRPDWSNDPVELMTFTNTYTKSSTKPSENGTNTGTITSPQTGDNSNLAVWFALLAVSAAGVMGAGVYSKRRRSSR